MSEIIEQLKYAITKNHNRYDQANLKLQLDRVEREVAAENKKVPVTPPRKRNTSTPSDQ